MERPWQVARLESRSRLGEFGSDTLGLPVHCGRVFFKHTKGYHNVRNSENRMIRDLQLAGLVEESQQQYLRAVRQLTAYYMIPPDQLK